MQDLAVSRYRVTFPNNHHPLRGPGNLHNLDTLRFVVYPVDGLSREPHDGNRIPKASKCCDDDNEKHSCFVSRVFAYLTRSQPHDLGNSR